MTTMNRTQATDDRWQTIQSLWQENQWLYVLIGIFIGIIFSQLVTVDITEFAGNLIPEAIGIGFTVLILDRIYQKREREQRQQREKERLVREMGSLDNSTALRASETLKYYGWAQDGTLVGAYLREANLKNIRIDKANLLQAHLVGVNLMYGEMNLCIFSHVQMSNSILRYGRFHVSSFAGSAIDETDFRDCGLRDCSFHNTSLMGSDFANADLEGADLRGAWLLRANLEGVRFGKASDGWLATKMDENTILPDGQSWSKGIDLEQYTDPDHPEFWRPKDFDSFDELYDNSEVPFWWRRRNRKDD